MRKYWKFLFCLIAFWASQVAAQTESRHNMKCAELAELERQMQPPQLARSIRDCIESQRYEDAMQVFMVYSVYGTFDQQRVRDESGYAALAELNIWIFGGYDRSTMDALRAVASRLRDHEDGIFQDTCAGIRALGPPDYRPDYLIGRGEYLPRKTKNDWLTEGFDPAVAWKRTLVDINQCPALGAGVAAAD